ncbi:MAG: type II secretion system minor pseudopilin GspK [Thiohalomonadaceae bacterium]
MRRQNGVALITVILIVALATTVAVSMAAREQYDIRRSGNLLQAEQAWLYVQGIEGWAAHILRRDREDGEVDHLDEDWATVLPPVPVDGGQLSGGLEDLQGRFNLNNLLQAGQIDEAALQQFRRLLQLLELDPQLAEVLADWLDADIEPRFPAGAEDGHYLGLERPYRSANSPMTSVSELRLLAGMDAEGYQRLAPYLAALPTRSRLNVNTASLPVLMSLAEEIGEREAEQLIADRGEDGYASVNEFLQHSALAGLELAAEQLSVGSEYFMLRSQVQFGRLIVSWQSLLQRDRSGQARVIRRSQASL